MKKIFSLMVMMVLIVACTKNETSKYAAKNYIIEKYNYVDTKIIEFSDIEKFSSPTRYLLSANLSIVLMNNYANKEWTKAFESDTKTEAIKILTNCIDSINVRMGEMIDDNIYEIVSHVDHPELHMGEYTDLPVFCDYFARKISFTTPEGYVKEDIIVYNEDYEISCMISDIREQTITYINSKYDFENTINDIKNDIIKIKRGYYRF